MSDFFCASPKECLLTVALTLTLPLSLTLPLASTLAPVLPLILPRLSNYNRAIPNPNFDPHIDP